MFKIVSTRNCISCLYKKLVATHLWSFSTINKGCSLFLCHFYELLHLFVLFKQMQIIVRACHYVLWPFPFQSKIIMMKLLRAAPDSHWRVDLAGRPFPEDQRPWCLKPKWPSSSKTHPQYPPVVECERNNGEQISTYPFKVKWSRSCIEITKINLQ